MPTTTTFNERLNRIEERAKRVDSKQRAATRRRKVLLVLAIIGALIAGASIAQDSMPQLTAWAEVAFDYVRAILPE